MCDPVRHDNSRQTNLSGRRVWMLPLVAVLSLAWMAAGAGQRDDGPRPAEMTVLRDIEYVPGGHERQKLDLYQPGKAGSANGTAQQRPLIVWVHGGAWRAGRQQESLPGPALPTRGIRRGERQLSAQPARDLPGPDPRLQSRHSPFARPCRGVWSGRDPFRRLGFLGRRAFGRVALSSKVQAVCDFFGPTDFSKMSCFWSRMDHDAPDSPESKLIGGPVQQNKDKVQRANPIAYVTKDDPPFLIVHGDKDPLVPHNQSEMLYDALKKAGVDATFYTVRGGGHGGFTDPNVQPLVTTFFNQHLRK